MAILVTCNGTDITNKVISYDWDKNICTSVGQMRMELAPSATPSLYQTLVLTEDGVKKGTFFIHTISRDYPNNTITINAQDASLKLQDYFISESIVPPSTGDGSYSAYWIKNFFTRAGISYSIPTEEASGSTKLDGSTYLGMCSAMDAITPLLQQNGWHMTFDADNVAIIGPFEATEGGDFADSSGNLDALSVVATQNDSMYRNRVVVWGSSNIETGQQIFVEHKTYNALPETDYKTVVVANPGIRTLFTANRVAARVLQGLNKYTYEVAIDYPGQVDTSVGGVFGVDLETKSYSGRVTTFGSSYSSDGLITHIVLGQRCPRMYADIDPDGTIGDNYVGGHVYVGTAGAGVWRKPLDGQPWTNFSTGLTDLNITDLAIQNGMFAAIGASGQLFLRYLNDEAWTPFIPYIQDSFDGNRVYQASEVKCTSVTINKTTGEVIAGYSTKENMNLKARSWIYVIKSKTNYSRYQLFDQQNLPAYVIVSLDNNGVTNTVSTIINPSGYSLSGMGDNVMWNAASQFGSPNYYGFVNSLSGIAIAFSGMYVDENPLNMPTTAKSQKAITGDGIYIYRTERTSTATLSTITTTEYRTRAPESTNAIVYTNAASNAVVAGGNRAVVTAHGDTNGFTFESTSLLGAAGKEVVVDGSYIAAGVAVYSGGAVDYYALSYVNEATTLLGMYKWGVGEDYVNLVDTISAPPTLQDGTFTGWGAPQFPLVVTEDYLIAYVEAFYEDIVIDGDTYSSIGVPGILFYDFSSRQLTCHLLNSYLKMFYTIMSDISLGAIGNNAYLLTYSDQYYVIKVTPQGVISTAFNPSSPADHFIADRSNLLLPNQQAANIITILNCATGSTIDNISGDIDDYVFAKQISQEGHILYYNSTNGNVYAKAVLSGVPLPSGVTISGTTMSGLQGDFIIPVNLDPYNGGGYAFNPDYSILALVHDSLYLEVSSTNFTFPLNNEVVRRGIYVPASGRYIPADYTVSIKEDSRLLQGYGAPAYTLVWDNANPFSVEISEESPVVVWGRTSYSGLVISGIQTGYSQAQVYASPRGTASTYSQIMLDSLNSNVTDLRTAFFLVGDTPETLNYTNYLLIPEIGASTTALRAVDVSYLTNAAGAIATSGILAPGRTYTMATFGGTVSHIETTKYQDVPYVFVSLGGNFWQKDGYYYELYIEGSGELPGDTVFFDETGNLPGHFINTIRVDDTL